MKIQKYVLRRIFKEECSRFLDRYAQNPLTGLKKLLDMNKIEYKTVGETEIIVQAGSRTLRVVQED